MNFDLDLLNRIARSLPYGTRDPEEIRLIAEMAALKLLEVSVFTTLCDGLSGEPLVVSRIRPRGQAALTLAQL